MACGGSNRRELRGRSSRAIKDPKSREKIGLILPKKKKKKKKKIIISANFSQTQKVRLLGFRKFQVFSPNRGDAKLFRKTVKSNLDNN